MDAVEVVVVGDVVVRCHLGACPVRELVWARRQRLESGPLDFLEELAPGLLQPPHRPVVALLHQFRDCLPQRLHRVEGPVAKHCQNPPLRDQDGGFDLRLDTRPARTSGNHRHLVVTSEIRIGRIELKVVPVDPRDADFRIVGDADFGDAAKELAGTHVTAHPRRQVLMQHRLDVGEIGGVQHRDEEHSLLHLARGGVHHVEPVTAEVDEGLLARAVHRRERPCPAQVPLAKVAVLKPVRLSLFVFLSQQHLGHVPTLKLPVNPRAVRLGSVRDRLVLGGEERPLQRCVVVELRR